MKILKKKKQKSKGIKHYTDPHLKKPNRTNLKGLEELRPVSGLNHVKVGDKKVYKTDVV